MQPLKATIDTKNPFYCPALSATAYLKNIHKTATTEANTDGGGFVTFAKMLDECGSNPLDSDGVSAADFLYDSEHDWIVGVNLGNRRRAGRGGATVVTRATRNRLESSVESQSVNSPSMDVDDFTPWGIPPKNHSTAINEQRVGLNKRKRASSESGSSTTSTTSGTSSTTTTTTSNSSSSSSEAGPPLPEYGKSILAANDSSFELEVRREKVNFDATGSEPTGLVNDSTLLLDDATLTADGAVLNVLMKKISAFLPGMRIEERLAEIPELDMQKVADFLAHNGYMNHNVLKLFRRTNVESLALGMSLYDEEGLNITGQDLIESLGKPYTFANLTELSFSESRVEDFNLIHLHHLPKLAVLYLNNTGIGNEAVYLLVPLKRTLRRLSLATNPDITSESTAALLLLAKLEFLSMCDTGVDMTGLRLFAKTILEERRTIDIEIPYSCEEYIDNLDSKYLVDIQPPLISSPDDCASLTVAGLKKNLAAHAERNSGIVASGTKTEMVPRLKEILMRREMDLVVAQMLLGA